MSKVEMSLREYDDLMDKLRVYERAIKLLTTPKIDEFEYNYFKDHQTYPLHVYSHVSDDEVLKLLRGSILENILNDSEIQARLEEYEDNLEFNSLSVHLFDVTHSKKEVEVGEE